MHTQNERRNADLLRDLDRAVEQDRVNSAVLLRLLVKVDRRKLWAELGFSSLFQFCQKRYAMSEPVAHKRIRAARVVWKRDEGKCRFRGTGGHVCLETRKVEHSLDNIELRCRAHNLFEAEREFGPLFMARFKAKAS